MGSDEASSVNQAVASGLTAGGGAYLKDLGSYYTNVGDRMIANTVPDKHIADMVDTALTELKPPSNQNFPKVATAGKAMGGSRYPFRCFVWYK